MAWLVVWPWYAFVEAHGGYSALLRHQQSYLGGFAAWWPNFLIQEDQAIALSGGDPLIWPSLFLVCLAIPIARPQSWSMATAGMTPWRRFWIIVAIGLILCIFVTAPYRLGLIMTPWLLTRRQSSLRLLGVWWLVLTVMTPFYHAYARLWLPYHAVNWLFMGWFVANSLSLRIALMQEPDYSSADRQKVQLLIGILGMFFLGSIVWVVCHYRHPQPQPDLLAPSNSLRQACDQISVILPDEVQALQVLARRPVVYYLLGRKPVFLMENLDQLRKPGNPKVWAVVDSAILRSEIGRGSEESSRNLLDRVANHWEVVQEIPTTLALPTLLDLDPEAARSTAADRTCRLWLLRPRRPGAAR